MSKHEAATVIKSKLLEKTIELYKSRSILLTNDIICEKTGLNYNWLITFCNVEDPGVNRIECLYEFLSKKKLDLN